MQDIESIIDALGASRITQALGVVDGALRNARRRGRFPAWWHPTIRDLAAETGVDVPDEMFSRRSTRKPPEPAKQTEGG